MNQDWHPLTEQYAREECDMTDRDRVIDLLRAYAIRPNHWESQLGVLMHNAALMLEQCDLTHSDSERIMNELLKLHSTLERLTNKASQ